MLLVTFLFVVLFGKLIYLEIFSNRKLQIKAIDQWTRDIPLTAERGDIFDRNGKILADSETSYTIYVRPNSVKNKDETAKTLARVFDIDEQRLREKLNSKVSELTLAKQVKKEKMIELINGNVTGVYYSQNIKRIYPNGDFLTQVLGFTNIDSAGQSGIESYYQNFLKGQDGYILTQTDLVGRELDSNITHYVEGQKGNNVYLTVDYYIQSFVESAVRDAYAKYNAKSVSCLVMNANNGEILAMAQRPSFDLNNVPRDDIAKLFAESRSTVVSNVYEPGSTFKILTAALGLESGVIDRNYRFHCPGYRIVDGKRIKCWKTIGHGIQTFDEGVQNSCNCLFMDIAIRLGAERFYNGIKAFNLTGKTGIDMTGEAKGLTIPYNTVKNVDIARMGFGQAIAVTGLGLATSVSSVINGGKMVTPHILNKVETKENKTLVQYYNDNSGKTVSQKTSDSMREILYKVVNLGSGKNARVNGFQIGGKTGTAQKYANGSIASGKYVSSFIGFSKIEKEDYVILFEVNEPTGYVYYGSIVSAPYVGQIFNNIFSYKGITPQYENPPKTLIMPKLIGLSGSEARNILYKMGIFYEEYGEGEVVTEQFPNEGSYITTNNAALIIR